MMISFLKNKVNNMNPWMKKFMKAKMMSACMANKSMNNRWNLMLMNMMRNRRNSFRWRNKIPRKEKEKGKGKNKKKKMILSMISLMSLDKFN